MALLRKNETFSADKLSDVSGSTEGGDPIEITGWGSEKPTSPNVLQYNTKIKSSLCKNYMERGTCPYGRRCQFAHGPNELKCNSDNSMSYKTRPCHSFERKGYCAYGTRCNFIHEN